jgi:hypothetical protein
MMAQNTVTGKVSDAAGDQLIGVNVLEKGSSNGTVTDVNGKFTLNVPQGATLVFSYIGYKTQELVVSGNNLDVVLYEDTELLDEVVVVGYGTQSKRNISGAISSVKAEDIVRSNSTTLSGALAGKVQGITTRAVDA